MRSPVIKHRSITIAGRKTGVSMEDEFWNGLREIAHSRDRTLYDLIADINAKRRSTNLSSALRLFVLQHYRDQLAQQRDRVVISLGSSNSANGAQVDCDFDHS